MACLRPTARPSATPGVEQNAPMLTPGVAKVAAVGGDREIAGRDELTAGRGRDAVHLRDDRLRQPRDRHHHPAAAREERLDAPGRRAIARISLRSWPAQKPRPRAAKHDHAHARVRADPIERRLQLVDERTRQRVELPRPIQVSVAIPSCDSTSSTPSIWVAASASCSYQPFCVLTSERETRAEWDGARGPGTRDLRGNRDARFR